MNRIMIILLPVLCILIGCASLAAKSFEKVYGGSNLDRGVFVSPVNGVLKHNPGGGIFDSPIEGRGYIAVGVTSSFGAGKEDVYLVKTDTDGEIQWSKTYGGNGDDNGWSVHETQDGFIIAGFTNSFGNGDFDFYLIKTNWTGDVEWTKTFGGSGSDRCWALILTSDNGFMLAGETTSSSAGEEDICIIKTDSRGNLQWSRTYGGLKSDRCFSIAQADDGGYMLAGQTYSYGAGDRDVCVIKTSATGNREWSKTFGGTASDVGHYITKTRDGCFMITGYTTSFAGSSDDPYLIKVDSQGDIKWERVLPMNGVNHTLTGEEATDGGFYLVGFSQYSGSGPKVGLLIKTDSEGQLAWNKDILPAPNGESFGYTVRATRDGGCIFTGHTTVNSAGHFDLLLVKH